MSLVQLRHKGKLIEILDAEVAWAEDPPRALRSLGQIIDNGLCHRCGSCVGICPTGVLGLDNHEYPIVKNLSACTDCDLCVKVCPGDEFDVKNLAQQMFGYLPDVEDMHGHFEKAYLSYATRPDIREHSTSGGLVTGLLLDLLDQGQIDGAVVISSDETDLWKGKPIVARDEAGILSAMKSKYAISPTNSVFSELCEVPGRYALVGLPCQIHGFHKAAELNRKLRDRVVLTIGLFCHAAVEHDPMEFIWGNVVEDSKSATRFISRVGKHPGTPYVERKNGTSTPVYFPHAKRYRPSSLEILNILYRLYTPQRCLTCYDSTAEFADIAVGDPWMAPPDASVDFYKGYSFALARTQRGVQALTAAEGRGALSLTEITKDHARSSNRMMGVEKRNRAFRVIETRRRQGHGVPDYGIPIPKVHGKHLILTELNILSHIFCFMQWGKKPLLKLSFSRLGYGLLYLNFLKRQFRNWRRDTRVRALQKLKGKSAVVASSGPEIISATTSEPTPEERVE